MRYAVLGSGSHGNATFIAHDGVSLLIDAGLSGIEIQRRMVAIGEDPMDLMAILLTHEHTDHIAGLEPILKASLPMLFCTQLCYDAIKWKHEPRFVQIFQAGDRFKVGPELDIQTFTVPHDAVDPVGFTISRGDRRLGYALDTGYLPASVRLHLQGCDAMVIESNHDPAMLANGIKPPYVKQRVASRVGHLSNEDLAGYLTSSDYDNRPRRLVLGHLSQDDNTAKLASLAAARALQRLNNATTEITVASQGVATGVFEL